MLCHQWMLALCPSLSASEGPFAGAQARTDVATQLLAAAALINPQGSEYLTLGLGDYIILRERR